MSNNNLNIKSDAIQNTSIDEDFSSRLGKLIDDLNISQNEFARQIDSTSAFVSNMIRGKSKPGLDFLQKIAGCYNVSLDWLILGKGSMYGEALIDSDWHNSVFLRLVLAKHIGRGSAEAQMLSDELLSNHHMSQPIISTERKQLLEQIAAETNVGPSIVGLYNQFIGISNLEKRNALALQSAIKSFQSHMNDPLADLIQNFKKQDIPENQSCEDKKKSSSQMQFGIGNKMAGHNFYEK